MTPVTKANKELIRLKAVSERSESLVLDVLSVTDHLIRVRDLRLVEERLLLLAGQVGNKPCDLACGLRQDLLSDRHVESGSQGQRQF